MTHSFAADLLDALENGGLDKRPWGFMRVLDAQSCDITVKYLHVKEGHRTSLQFHTAKDELLFIIDGTGFVELHQDRFSGAGSLIRIRPGSHHRVTGPLTYLEISSYDDGTDTIRLEDDYRRTA